MARRATTAAGWLGRVLGAVFVIALAGACGQSAPGEELLSASANASAAEAAVAMAESPVTGQRVAELQQRFVVTPVERPATHAREPVRESKPKPVIQAGVATGFVRAGERVKPVFSAEARRSVVRTASVELPAAASGTARLEDDTSHLAITFALDGAEEAPVEVAGGIARYAGALGGADVVHRVHAEGTEDFVVFEERPAQEELRYVVDVSRVAGLRLVGNTVELMDEGGAPRLRVAPPSVVDAGGAEHEATLAIDGCAFDASPAAPWGRAVTRPGAASCVVRVAWAGVTYPAVVDPAWITTGSMTAVRVYHTATLLGSGKVLVAGGFGSGTIWASAELYDPTSGTFAATGSMIGARDFHTATLLGTGKVLVAGGQANGNYLTSAELYDPSTGGFAATTPLATLRAYHTATLLGSGKVLVAGGQNSANWLASAELYDPASGFAAGGSMTTSRVHHSATLLGSGKVLMTGGFSAVNLASAELYDPSTGGFAATGSMPAPRRFHTGTLLGSGKVLVAGGSDSANLSSALLYDPTAGTFAATGSMATARSNHTATLLGSGQVLVAAGSNGATLSSAELYDPTGAVFAATSSLANARYYHTATLLGSGKVLVTGGPGLSSAELFGLANGDTGCTAGGQCLSGVCNDGVCCSGACGAVCTSCTAGTGACVAVTNADDPDTCTGANTCDATAACRKKLGQTCSLANECASAICDRACCLVTCGGVCQACNGSGACVAVTNADDPDTCTGANTCDAAGACKKKPGQSCSLASQCASAVCDTTCCAVTCGPCQTCNGSGACVAVKNADDPDTCTGTHTCDPGGACKLVVGQPCAAASDCAGGSCADGYCCNTACGGACDRCNLAGKLGTCSPAPLGDPGAPSCAPQACDGTSGTCPAPGTCLSDAQCAAGTYCAANGQCAPQKAQGAACSAAVDCKLATCVECASGFCADGFCCNTACNAGCMACSAALKGQGADGTCGNVAADTDPHDACPPDAGYPASCKGDGLCDGNGTCRQFAKNTVACGATSCTNNEVSGQLCNGAGICAQAPSVPCEPYACANGACTTTCTADADCAATAFCDTASKTCATQKKNGKPCQSSGECENGSCVDGVCCDTSCTSQCAACDVTGSEGVCSPVTGAPHGTRQVCTNAGMECGGTCDGADPSACKFAPQDTACGMPSCDNGSESDSACDGQGLCKSLPERFCAPYTCGAKTCKTTCVSEADCSGGNACKADKTCGPKAGATCKDDHTVVDGDGHESACDPYKCTGGSCGTICTIVDDCVSPNICNGTGKCVPPSATQDMTQGGCGCRTAGQGGGGAGAGLMALALAMAARRRRAR
jgi:MYXO-CTERM domain-containing protein